MKSTMYGSRLLCCMAVALCFVFTGIINGQNSPARDIQDYVCGDANGDGDVNIGDGVFIINYVFKGGDAPSPLEAGDASGDGEVNIGDGVYLINYIFKGGPAPKCQLQTGTVVDIDGNVYTTVKICDRWWMAENLKTTHYRNGTPIPEITSSTEWANASTGAYCAYNNNLSNIDVYGLLYNWFTIEDPNGLAPAGWRVPTDDEWKQLEMCLGMSQEDADLEGWRGTDQGGKLKETGTTHWYPPNEGATNESGFSALPGGYRYYDGNFLEMGYRARFWSSTEISGGHAWYRHLYYDYSQVGRHSYYYKQRGLSIRCVMDASPAPQISTGAASNITNVTADCAGDVISEGGSAVTAYGICWSEAFPPTVADDTTNEGIGTGLFTSSITGLTPNTQYYFRAYATNSASTAYGTIDSLTTLDFETGTVTDIDGNIYQTVKIGDQWWMAENLKVTHYRNGDPIDHITDETTWSGLTNGAYCEYDNNPANVTTYGLLYNWYGVDDSRNIAPEGWHVPTDEEWKQLEMYLGMSQTQADSTIWRGTDEGGALKDTTHWVSPNTGANNESGFTALPGGWRSPNGYFDGMGYLASFWSSTEYTSSNAWDRLLRCDYSQVARSKVDKRIGLSIRCVKDE